MDEIFFEQEPDSRQVRADPIRAVLAPLWRSRQWIVTATVAGAALGLFLGFVKPNTYRSTGKLLVRWGARESATPEMALTGQTRLDAGMVRDGVNNELHILSDPEVFRLTATLITPKRVLEPYQPGQLDGPDTSIPVRLFHAIQGLWFSGLDAERSAVGHSVDDCERCIEATTRILMKDVKLTVEPYSNVITISYVATDPKLAQDVVGAFMDASDQHHRNIHEIDTTLVFLDVQLEKANSALHLAENDFQDYRLQCGVWDPELQQLEILKKIDELKDSIRRDEYERVVKGQRKAKIEELLPSIPAYLEVAAGESAAPSAERQSVLTEIQKLETELAMLPVQGGSLSERQRQEDAINNRLGGLRLDLDRLEQADLQRVSRTPNPTHQKYAEELVQLEIDLSGIEGSMVKHEKDLSDKTQEMATIEQCKPVYGRLEETFTNARNRYDKLLNSVDATDSMALLDKADLSNLLRIQQANRPFEKEGPKRGKLLILGVLLGAFGGAVLALLRQAFDRTVRTPEDVSKLLGVSVIGIVPDSGQVARKSWLALRRAAL